MNYFPIFANLAGRPVLVVGGGSVAARKISLLLDADAQVRVVANQLNAELSALAAENKILWLAEEFRAEHIRTVFLIIAASSDQALNRRVFQLAESYQKPVNVVDDRDYCSFIFPSIINRNPIQIAVSSSGSAPVLARLLREKLEALLPHSLGDMAEISGRWRDAVKAKLKSVTERRRFWEKQFNGRFAALVKNRQNTLAERELAGQLEQSRQNDQGGFVSLVGAGPGDAGLLTLKGLQEIQQADVVLYDALVSDGILSLVRRDAERIFVGKRARGDRTPQEDTNALMVRLAREGRRVVRLKGGDPFVFGRGGEELETLARHQIPFSVVPGITAAVGATAYAGIPLTHRDYAQSAVFVTGHRKADAPDIEWQTLARSRQTLVIYMGALKAALIAERLQQHGRSPDTPAAVISQGTLPAQKTATGTLANLAELAETAPNPALIVIGEVVGLHEKLAWFGENAKKESNPAEHAYFALDGLGTGQEQQAA
ncbi:uroporphyrinogen-III C-methyltransferase [Neisseria meningitidis]|uniref:siroheme synthase CysG n=1 Tax=Neisseria meningitidis TaxID=487 RepID=UPI000E57E3F6|nr:siroheme synthase CysG [Neisseria meningitidis]MBH2011249.1 uroporphyrinogen-III C-methyltransferase [Neisseria meningitidis]MBH2013325.1 uroporphyrinogen-III C-methyltransferase [Neisseria meningitidis]MBH2020896.1 uroporphyrinogen-III C-methyltransferase [Neisseria meningitidis]MBH2025448.1 uroporphyrinogen-III C-methyltransferase [Neisseria meningitidis]MBH2027128.1 uroporphyrinogen-III C-methyltransferase [Neisseria meningitidis]